MLKKILGNLLENFGYVSMQDYNVVIYDNVNLQKDLSELSKKCSDFKIMNDQLVKEMKILMEENNSLWDMLDEMKSSESFGPDQMQSTMDELQEMLTDEMMRDFKPIGEA